MDFYYLLKKINISEINKIVKRRIIELEKKSNKKNNRNYIGFKLDYNPNNYQLKESIMKTKVNIRNIHDGYINKKTKIVYGVAYDDRGLISNDGKYYIVDDDSYILEFCKYIKSKDVVDEEHLFDYVLKFIRKYLGIIRNNDRELMHQMIYKNDRLYLDPVVEHKLSDFYQRGNAMCTEISLLAENILSVFGFKTYYIVGNLRVGEIDGYHSFNLISYKEKKSNETKHGIIDFSKYTDVYDINYKIIAEKPYIVYFESIDDDFLNNFVLNEESIIYEDYDFLKMNNLVEMKYDRDREYYIFNEDKEEKIFKKINI